MLKIERRRQEPDIVVLALEGRIVLGPASKQFEATIEECLQQSEKKVVFDLSDVNYIDSTGVGIIVFCCGKLKEIGGKLCLAGTKGMVDRALRMAKIDRVVELHPTIEAAVEGFHVSERPGPAR